MDNILAVTDHDDGNDAQVERGYHNSDNNALIDADDEGNNDTLDDTNGGDKLLMYWLI